VAILELLLNKRRYLSALRQARIVLRAAGGDALRSAEGYQKSLLGNDGNREMHFE
jgi:hypothetical protein